MFAGSTLSTLLLAKSSTVLFLGGLSWVFLYSLFSAFLYFSCTAVHLWHEVRKYAYLPQHNLDDFCSRTSTSRSSQWTGVQPGQRKNKWACRVQSVSSTPGRFPTMQNEIRASTHKNAVIKSSPFPTNRPRLTQCPNVYRTNHRNRGHSVRCIKCRSMGNFTVASMARVVGLEYNKAGMPRKQLNVSKLHVKKKLYHHEAHRKMPSSLISTALGGTTISMTSRLTIIWRSFPNTSRMTCGSKN